MSIPRECKRLIEVDFPLAEVSKQSAREKSIRHGHPSTLHLWWARRPLAACRAVLLGLLLPDPSDPLCPKTFKEEARRLVAGIAQPPETDEELRRAILGFIANFSNWDNSSDNVYLNIARGLVRAAQGEEPSLVVDPFAGGGSISLEALRIGCDTFASDLNPVACLILKVLLEDLPRNRSNVANELRRAGTEVKVSAEKALSKYYPDDPDGAAPIVYLWARTVRCEAPNCGAEIPLVRSFWLCKKPIRRQALRWKIRNERSRVPIVEFETFEPRNDTEVPHGTVSRANATCLACGGVLPAERVRTQLAAQNGGADVAFDSKGHRLGGARLLAVVTLKPGEKGRSYRLPVERDYDAVRNAIDSLQKTEVAGSSRGLSPIPDEPLPPVGTLGFRVQRYGMKRWGDLFTARQKIGLLHFANAIRTSKSQEVVRELLAFTLSHTVDRSCSLCQWSSEPYMETVLHVFNLQALPMVWDFAEAVLTSESTGSFMHALDVKAACVERVSRDFGKPGQVQLADATQCPLPDSTAKVWFTDPPYYDAVPYADLSDYFYVWLKRALPGNPLLHDPFSPRNPLTPKTLEIVEDVTKGFEGRAKDGKFFEERMALAFAEGRRVLQTAGIGCVVFAHKTTEGWESLLSGMHRGGWVITASWPVATERPNRLRAHESAVLSASVHLICRPRAPNAPIGDWDKVLQELPIRVGAWMERLESEGIRGADLVFACIGPALEIYSRYSAVETAEGRAVGLPEFLQKVWEVVGRKALEKVIEGEGGRPSTDAVGALEEDARLTALFLWTLQNAWNGSKVDSVAARQEEPDEATYDDGNQGQLAAGTGYKLLYDVVRRFAQPLGIHLDAWEGRIVETDKGVVRLLSVVERVSQLFPRGGIEEGAASFEYDRTRGVQRTLFPEEGENRKTPKPRSKMGAERPDQAPSGPAVRESTTLDRVHMSMLFQRSGETAALRDVLIAELKRGPQFLRVANALSTLYPRGSEEKRLIEAVLLAAPGR